MIVRKIVGDRERHKRQHANTVHREVTQGVKEPVTNISLPYISQEDEHGDDVHKPELQTQMEVPAVVMGLPRT